MADPGEGPGGGLPPYFQTKLRPEGPKKIFKTAPSPLIQCLDDRPDPPLSECLDRPLGWTPERSLPLHVCKTLLRAIWRQFKELSGA